MLPAVNGEDSGSQAPMSTCTHCDAPVEADERLCAACATSLLQQHHRDLWRLVEQACLGPPGMWRLEPPQEELP
jgi:predicted amidophosphoribosyltransferase